MKIIIPRVPKETTCQDLARFVNEGMKTSISLPFVQQISVVSSEVIIIRDEQGLTEYHGMMNIMPDSAARKAVKKLNGLQINGKTVGVREYKERKQTSFQYDPTEERRRFNVTVEKAECPSIEGLSRFARDYST